MSAPRPTPGVRRLEPYTVPAAGRRGCLRLDFNENLAGPSPRVLERLRRLSAEDIALYPDETAARAAVARRFGCDGGLDCVLTSGVDEAIRLVCDAFVRAAERVLLLDPGYAMYRFYATLAGARVAGVDYAPGPSFPVRGLRRALRSGACRLLIIGDPNNPTGTPAPEGVIEEIAFEFPRTLVLADEAYAEFAGRSSIDTARRLPNLLVARTFSKAYGLAGLRAGVLLGAGATLSWVARMRSPYAVNAAALAALEAALEDPDWVDACVAEVRAARTVLAHGLAALGVPVYDSEANFVVARFGDRAPGIREALRRRGILVRDRSGHPLMRGTLRIGLGTRAAARACLDALAGILADEVAPRQEGRR